MDPDRHNRLGNLSSERERIVRLAAIILFLALPVLASDPVASDRMPTNTAFPSIPWKGLVGVEGGIPARTTVYTSYTSSASASQINTGIDNCPSNQVVSLGSGTYSLSGAINLDKDGVTVRGTTNSSGVPTTILNFTGSASPLVDVGAGGGALGTPNGWFIFDLGGYTTRTVTGVPSRGTTQITLSSTTGLAANQWLMLSADNGTSVGGSGIFDANGRPATIIVWCTNVSGTTVDFLPPFQADYWSGTIQAHYRAKTDTIKLSGIEDVKLTRSSASVNGDYMNFAGTAECWAKNVWTDSVDDSEYHCMVYAAYRTELRHCNFAHWYSYDSATYGIKVVQSSFNLFIDNIIHDGPNFVVMYGMSHSALYGNYMTNEPYIDTNFLSQIVFFHGSHNAYNLFEQNVFPRSFHDTDISDSRNTVYHRNWMMGWDGRAQSAGGKANTILVSAWCSGCPYTQTYFNKNFSAVANLFGRTGVTDAYNDTANDFNTVNGVYRFDSTSDTSLSRKTNYNYFNAAVPAGEALGSGEALVNSYLMSANDLGQATYPAFNPGSPSSANVTNIQAGHRFIWTNDFASAQGGGGGVINTATASGGAKGLTITGGANGVTIR